jgi:hypothetical protein
MGALNTATFVFKQDKDIRLVRRFQSPFVMDGAFFSQATSRYTHSS